MIGNCISLITNRRFVTTKSSSMERLKTVKSVFIQAKKKKPNFSFTGPTIVVITVMNKTAVS